MPGRTNSKQGLKGILVFTTFALCALAFGAWPTSASDPASPSGAGQGVGAAQDALDMVVSTLMRTGDAAANKGPAARSGPSLPVEGGVTVETPADGQKAQPGDVRVNKQGTVDLHVANMSITDILRMISEQTRTNIVASKAVQGTVSANLYGVTLDKALDVILSTNGFGYRRDGDFVYVYSKEELAQIDQTERKAITRVFRLRYVTAKDAESLVAPLLSPGGKIAKTPPASEGLQSADANGGSGTSQGGSTGGNSSANSDTIVVVDYPENVDRISEVLRQFDVRPQQVLVEATILRASLNEDNAMGIDFTTVGGIDFEQLNSVSPAAQSIATGLTPENKLDDTTFTARTGFNQNVPTGGFTFGIIKDQVGFFIRALEQITDVTVLANPKILALNKQKGEVIVGQRDGYLTTTITETTAVQTVEFLETGTRLLFRPFIFEDGQIRMEVHPEDSTGGLTASNLPFKRTTEVTTNIMVRDGHTILIGGLFREVSNATRSQVPVLGNVPIAGALFRSTNDTMSREEVIILLTVRIVRGEPEENAGKELRQDTERYRLGQRREAQILDRERLSQAHYHWALEHLSQGDTGKALRDVNLSIQTNPHQLEAYELRDKIQGKRTWDEEASAVRHTLYDLINSEGGKPEPDFGRPAPPFKMPEGFEGPSGEESDELTPAPVDGAPKVEGKP